MKISEIGIQKIKTREELRLTAYRCEAGVLTIGYGHTAGVKAGDKITEMQAVEFFKRDVAEIERHLNKMIEQGTKFRQSEYDALISLIFTIGLGSFQMSTLRKKILSKAPATDCAAEFRKWIYVTKTFTEKNAAGELVKVKRKVVSNGLKNRRNSEYNQYLDLSGDYRNAGIL